MAQRGTRVRIDLDELAKLCALQCTDSEIAAWFKVTTRTIERRRLEPEFAAVMERGKAMGRISVRRLQMRMLENGNATMAVWLGKQLLGQVDQIQHNLAHVLIVQPEFIRPAEDRGSPMLAGTATIEVTPSD